jgi:signal transduction histidine kinase/ActR/RegA family two-component response regulator
MPKLAVASAHPALRSLTGGNGGVRLHDDETTDLRRLLLELRSDLPPERGPARESDRARFAEALAALGELAITTEDLELLFGAACELVVETLAVDAVALFEETRQPGQLTLHTGAGTLAEATGSAVDGGADTQAGFALAQRGSTATADARAAWAQDAFLARHGLVAAALAVLPGYVGPRALLGAYAVRRRAFAPDEVRFLEAAAGSLSAAMERRRAERERADLQARLALADRLVSVGTLAAGVAHELNNPLAYVNANLTFLGEQVAHLTALLPASARADRDVADALEQLVEAARDAREGAERMRVIVRDLKTLSRADDGKVGPLELGPVVETCVNVAWNEIKHRAQLVRDLQPTPVVRGSEARLGQVLLNLLVNAAQAVPEGCPDAHRIRVRTGLHPDGRVVIEVSDTGCGIAPEHLPRIFDPFYTTKPPGVGTGLGLSICHGIVSGMKGEIEVESAPGKGSTFRVLLPAMVHEPSDDGQVEAPRRATPTARSRILVVDDEPLVGTVLQRTLGVEHELVVCESARAALERIERGERFDLIFSDLLMPDLTGMDLHRELTAVAPTLAARMVFLSGGACTDAARAFLDQPGREYIEKPFELETLRRVIAAHLGEARDAGRAGACCAPCGPAVVSRA